MNNIKTVQGCTVEFTSQFSGVIEGYAWSYNSQGLVVEYDDDNHYADLYDAALNSLHLDDNWRAEWAWTNSNVEDSITRKKSDSGHIVTYLSENHGTISGRRWVKIEGVYWIQSTTTKQWIPYDNQYITALKSLEVSELDKAKEELTTAFKELEQVVHYNTVLVSQGYSATPLSPSLTHRINHLIAHIACLERCNLAH